MKATAVQICNGLGAGNIGDELMAHAFWDALPDDVRLEVEVFPNSDLAREPYPSRHRYVRIGWDGVPRPTLASAPGLLVGDTPVTESLGVDWPLRFLGPRLEAFHRGGQPVDALGVGLEPLRSDEARSLFGRCYLPIRSWTVRTAACRDVLVGLGVPEDRIAVGADWAWLYRPRSDRRDWGARTWTELGVDLSRPLLVANVINEIWRERGRTKQALAAAFDSLASRWGVQVAFFCQETREGEFYDLAAARETAALMRERSVVVPNLYYSPDEALGLLSHASVTFAGRYHFVVESVLAGAVPVCLTRSEKMEGLLDDCGLPRAGRIEDAPAESVVAAVRQALATRDPDRRRLEAVRRRMEDRARTNFSRWRPRRERGAAASRRR